MGAELTDTLLEPLTAGIYGSNSYEMSLNALFPMLEEWEQRYGSITRGMREARKAARGMAQPPSAFFSFNGGTHRLVQTVVPMASKERRSSADARPSRSIRPATRTTVTATG